MPQFLYSIQSRRRLAKVYKPPAILVLAHAYPTHYKNRPGFLATVRLFKRWFMRRDNDEVCTVAFYAQKLPTDHSLQKEMSRGDLLFCDVSARDISSTPPPEPEGHEAEVVESAGLQDAQEPALAGVVVSPGLRLAGFDVFGLILIIFFSSR
jgi:hypothetical protein